MTVPANVIPFARRRVEAEAEPDEAPANDTKKTGISAGVVLLLVGGVVAIAVVRQQAAEAKERERLRELEEHLEAVERNEAASSARFYDRPMGPPRGPWF